MFDDNNTPIGADDEENDDITQSGKPEDDKEEITLPKWEWLLIAAAALRVFMPIIIAVAVLLALFTYFLLHVIS